MSLQLLEALRREEQRLVDLLEAVRRVKNLIAPTSEKDFAEGVIMGHKFANEANNANKLKFQDTGRREKAEAYPMHPHKIRLLSRQEVENHDLKVKSLWVLIHLGIETARGIAEYIKENFKFNTRSSLGLMYIHQQVSVALLLYYKKGFLVRVIGKGSTLHYALKKHPDDRLVYVPEEVEEPEGKKVAYVPEERVTIYPDGKGIPDHPEEVREIAKEQIIEVSTAQELEQYRALKERKLRANNLSREEELIYANLRNKFA